jgi:hypothetical protein
MKWAYRILFAWSIVSLGAMLPHLKEVILRATPDITRIPVMDNALSDISLCLLFPRMPS